ncbi:MAG: hypothetical protein BGO89_06265 [Candidatus Kapaibacterium thiocyanatum]|uniref:Tyr recombinase domain-containing protein n=1 Tax=Candidatus Kapaibacterium thiocyanatum TaxID=1895771 RepID=A0A1M3KYT9_9BACT|nr:MAG: hypothetical protein BGO89_06265 ['Candidatus Kapabacteria' thiocyanatum]
MPVRVARDLERYQKSEPPVSWEAQEDGEEHTGTPFMFNQRGQRLNDDGWHWILKTITKRSGLQRPVSLHYLRHSISTHLLEDGLPLAQVPDFLGHKHLETTQVYTKVSAGQLKKLHCEPVSEEHLP